MLRVHVKQATHSGPDMAEEVMRRIKEREQARVRQSGTLSVTNWRYDARRFGRSAAFQKEPDEGANRILARCSSGR